MSREVASHREGGVNVVVAEEEAGFGWSQSSLDQILRLLAPLADRRFRRPFVYQCLSIVQSVAQEDSELVGLAVASIAIMKTPTDQRAASAMMPTPAVTQGLPNVEPGWPSASARPTAPRAAPTASTVAPAARANPAFDAKRSRNARTAEP